MRATSPVLLVALAAAAPAQQWTKLCPADGTQVAAFDLTRSRTVLYAFGDAGPETWTWAGSGWTQHLLATTPNRVPDACAYDLARDRLVLPLAGAVFETWEHDGTSWSL